jgi:hypothetical protein
MEVGEAAQISPLIMTSLGYDAVLKHILPQPQKIEQAGNDSESR